MSCVWSQHTRNRNGTPGSCHSVRWFTDYTLAPCWNNQTKKSCFSVILIYKQSKFGVAVSKFGLKKKSYEQ